MKTNIGVGSPVILAPLMTVEQLLPDDLVQCCWTLGEKEYRYTFPRYALIRQYPADDLLQRIRNALAVLSLEDAESTLKASKDMAEAFRELDQRLSNEGDLPEAWDF